MAHLMFGILALAADKLMRLVYNPPFDAVIRAILGEAELAVEGQVCS
jgi:hypothetical protein